MRQLQERLKAPERQQRVAQPPEEQRLQGQERRPVGLLQQAEPLPRVDLRQLKRPVFQRLRPEQEVLPKRSLSVPELASPQDRLRPPLRRLLPSRKVRPHSTHWPIPSA